MYNPYLYTEGVYFAENPNYALGFRPVPSGAYQIVPSTLGYPFQRIEAMMGASEEAGSFGTFTLTPPGDGPPLNLPEGRYYNILADPPILTWIPGYIPAPPPLNMYFHNYSDFRVVGTPECEPNMCRNDETDMTLWDLTSIPAGYEVVPANLDVQGYPPFYPDDVNLPFVPKRLQWYNNIRLIGGGGGGPTPPPPGYWWPDGSGSQQRVPYGKTWTTDAVTSGLYNVLRNINPFPAPAPGYWVPNNSDAADPTPIPVGYRLGPASGLPQVDYQRPTFLASGNPYDIIQRIPPREGFYFPPFLGDFVGEASEFPIYPGYEIDPTDHNYSRLRLYTATTPELYKDAPQLVTRAKRSLNGDVITYQLEFDIPDHLITHIPNHQHAIVRPRSPRPF